MSEAKVRLEVVSGPEWDDTDNPPAMKGMLGYRVRLRYRGRSLTVPF